MGRLNIFQSSVKHFSSIRNHCKPYVYFVLGGPGSGKGTQCQKLVTDHGFVHLSAGDLLRAERDSGSDNATLINDVIKAGQIVPVAITCGLLKQAMERAGWAEKKFLVDGFPRNQDNYDGWFDTMGSTVHIDRVLFFECSEAALTERINIRS